MSKIVLSCAVLFVLVLSVTPASAATCESLAGLKLPNTTITSAQTVAAGEFTPPAGGRGAPAPLKDLPAFCRVTATLRPSSDSDIKMEVWLPSQNWNGKLEAVGNGGWNGSISYNALSTSPGLGTALAKGYAAVASDLGHTGGNANFAIGHPEKVIDFGYRAVHEMTVQAKAITNAFYGNAPKYSYFYGCSAGGREAMKAAQMYPEDYDGIIAGSPGLDWTSRAAQAVRIDQMVLKDPSAKIPTAKLQLLNTAALNACDALDGAKDNIIENPKACKFDPGVLACKAADDGSCLTASQVELARAVYTSPVNSKTKREITGLYPGSELAWTDSGWSAPARSTGLEQFRNIVYQDPQWDISKFNWDTDVPKAEEVDKNTINALDPNLKKYFDHGGKLIQYHGWSDAQISPGNSTQYYQRVVDANGGSSKVMNNYRLFMVPGMGHCGGGTGAATFDMLTALEKWVEQKQAPDSIPGSHATQGKIDRTRPLCPYPQLATYKGSGDINDAANFSCK
jgi:feruloyl esterase